ncbi:MAG: iron uptake protein [Aquabacterium sp.]
MASPSHAPGAWPIAQRVAASLLGGYAFTWGFSVLGVASLVAMGVDFHDAEHGVLILAWLVFLTAFLWAFAASSVARVWGVLAGGAALMTGSAWVVQWAVLA